jgi:hypothetical protein
MSKPVRIQLRRIKGWRMPPNTVKVDRSTKWGNPFSISRACPAERAVAAFKRAIADDQFIDFDPRSISDLHGKNLACWCPLDQPCHADVLLELSNPS